IAVHQPRQHEADDRIDHAEDDGMARHRLEIFPAALERAVQVGNTDGADDGASRRAGCIDICDISLNWRGHGRCLPLRQRPQFRATRRALLRRSPQAITIRPGAQETELAVSRTVMAWYSQKPPLSCSSFGDCRIGNPVACGVELICDPGPRRCRQPTKAPRISTASSSSLGAKHEYFRN